MLENEKTDSRFSCFMAHQGSFEKDGIVRESLPNTLFRVELEDGSIVLCHLAGKMRMNFVKILPGDNVRIEMTPYDMSKGRIVRRYREGERPNPSQKV